MTLPPSEEQELHVLKQALAVCRAELESFRKQGDDLAAELRESDLNVMLERIGELTGVATEATEATDI